MDVSVDELIRDLFAGSRSRGCAGGGELGSRALTPAPYGFGYAQALLFARISYSREQISNVY
jgi:hypothetical protein